MLSKVPPPSAPGAPECLVMFAFAAFLFYASRISGGTYEHADNFIDGIFSILLLVASAGVGITAVIWSYQAWRAGKWGD